MKHHPDLIAVRDGEVLIAEVKADHRPDAVQAMRFVLEAAGAREVQLQMRYGTPRSERPDAGVITGQDA